ncbi:MAG: hypothetical protein H6711_24125 [Myxococcales bacterium]|nr:hypothetical protein [Myxococcales bacterium]
MARAPIDLPPIVDLTIPEVGSVTASRVLSAALRRLLGDLGAVLHPAAAGGDARLRADILDLVRRCGRERPGALASVLRRADVGAWIRCLRPGGPPAIDRALLLRRLAYGLARGLADVGGMVVPLRIPGPLPRRLSSLATREVLEIPTEADALAIDGEGLAILARDGRPILTRRHDEGAASPLYTPVTGSIVLAAIDDNPLADREAHPDKSGNAIDLGDASPATWAAALADALVVIGDHMPALRAEIDLYIQQFVPVGVDPERHLSASFQEAIGTIYLSLHPRPMTMVEAVIHEFSHNKLGALLELDPVLENAFTSVHRSPVRPDPRPLHGLLLALHAFLPVARLYEVMLAADDPRLPRPEGAARLRQIIASNHEAAEVLAEHGRPTAIGRPLLDELARWDQRFTAT